MRRSPALLVLLATASCGYTTGFENPHGISSVAIQTVEDRSFRRQLAELLTRQLGRDLTRFTGLIPGRVASADARLEVTIEGAPGRSVVEGDGGAIVEGAIGLDAVARLIAPGGRVLHERRYNDWAEYRSPVGETRGGALDEAIADLARKILLGLEDELQRPEGRD